MKPGEDGGEKTALLPEVTVSSPHEINSKYF